MRWTQARRFLALLCGVAVLVGITLSAPVNEAIQAVLAAARPFILAHEVSGLLVFAALSAASAIAFFFSTAILVPLAVHVWGKPLTMVVLWASWLVGAALSYWLGRRPGRRLAKWLVSERRVAQYERRMSVKATFPLVVLFQVAVPSEVPGYVLGALRYRFAYYMAARALAELPFAVGIVLLGESLVQRRAASSILLSLLGVGLSVAALYWLHRRMPEEK